MAVYSLLKKNYTVAGRVISDTSPTTEILAFGSADAVSVNFSFDTAWDGYEKNVYFRAGENHYSNTYPLYDGSVTVPGYLLISAKTIYFKIVGVKGLLKIETEFHPLVVAGPVTTGAYVDGQLLEELDDLASTYTNKVANEVNGLTTVDTYASTAFLEIGQQISGNGIHFESLVNGTSGNEYRLAVTQGVGALTVAYAGKTITVDLASGGSNANVVLNKILNQANTNAVINGWSIGASNGEGLVVAMSATNFSGGDNNTYNYATTAQHNELLAKLNEVIAELKVAGLMEIALPG
jgi:hypothetical protein